MSRGVGRYSGCHVSRVCIEIPRGDEWCASALDGLGVTFGLVTNV